MKKHVINIELEGLQDIKKVDDLDLGTFKSFCEFKKCTQEVQEKLTQTVGRAIMEFYTGTVLLEGNEISRPNGAELYEKAKIRQRQYEYSFTFGFYEMLNVKEGSFPASTTFQLGEKLYELEINVKFVD